jgi:hypothetical protein
MEKGASMIKIFTRNFVFITMVWVLPLALSQIIRAQNAAERRFYGKWITGAGRENCLVIEDNMIAVSLTIQDLDGMLFVKMESQDADAFNQVADETVVDGDKIKITFGQLDALYKGKINEADNQIKGTIAFLGRIYPLSFMKIMQVK